MQRSPVRDRDRGTKRVSARERETKTERDRKRYGKVGEYSESKVKCVGEYSESKVKCFALPNIHTCI